MFSCLQILEALLWFVLITLLNVTLIILTLSVSRLVNLLLRRAGFLLFLYAQCLASISRWIAASGSWKRFWIFVICFFSSRRRHTIFDCDWSSDVCSSDLGGGACWGNPGRTDGTMGRWTETRLAWSLVPWLSLRRPRIGHGRLRPHDDHDRVRRVQVLRGRALDVGRGHREVAVQVAVDFRDGPVEQIVVLQRLRPRGRAAGAPAAPSPPAARPGPAAPRRRSTGSSRPGRG